jgi:hypothetical protein
MNFSVKILLWFLSDVIVFIYWKANNLERQIQTVVFELGDIKLKLIIPVKVVNKSVGFFSEL